MTSPFAVAGPRLRENNIAVLPILAGGKMPGILTTHGWRPETKWQRFCDRLPTDFEMRIWETWVDAGVGVAFGGASAPAGLQLVGADIDTDDAAVIAAIFSVLPPSPVRKAGRKGYTLFYLASPAVKSRPYNDGNKQRLLDLLCSGRQTVLPPSIHPDTGAPYVWLTPDTLENYDVADLPVLPDDVADRLGEALRPWGYQPPELHAVQGSATLDPSTSPHRALNEAALANLDAWVPAMQLHGCIRAGGGYRAVAHWTPSGHGKHIHEREPTLSIKPEGIRDFGDADTPYTAIDLVMQAFAADLDTAFKWLQDRVAPQKPVLLAIKAPKAEPTLAPADEPVEDNVVPIRSNLSGLVQAVAPLRERPPEIEPSGSAAVLPAHLCQPAGLLGQVVEWMTATAAKPVPQHNLGAAITLLGAIMGRRFESPTRARTNFYVMGLAPSGFGKDHPMAAARELAMACGLERFLAAEETKSDSAIRKMLERFPVSLMMMDEFGGFMRKVLDRRAAAHDKRMRDLMLTFFSRANQDYMGSEGASERAVMIRNPHLCIYGASTPDDLWDAFDSSSGKDGLLARFLVLDAGDKRPRRVRPAMDITQPPVTLVRAIRAMMEVRPPGNLNGIGDQRVRPIRAVWGDGAEEWFIACDERNMELSDLGGARGTVYARAAEHILKLALVYAVGCDAANPVITVAGLEWGQAVIEHSQAALFAAMDDRVADNDKQREYQLVLRMIRESGAYGLSVQELNKAINGRVDNRRRDDILGQLKDAGEIVSYVGSGPRGGRPVVRWRARIEGEEAA